MILKILQALLVTAALAAFGLYLQDRKDRPKPPLPADHAIEVQAEVAPAPITRSQTGSMEMIKTEPITLDDGTSVPGGPPPASAPAQAAPVAPAQKKRERQRVLQGGVNLSERPGM